MNEHKHTWAEHEYEALERGCNLATIKNELDQKEIEGLVDNEEMLYVGGIYVHSLNTWAWADGWPSMKYSNWMNRKEPSEIDGRQSFMAVVNGKWSHADGEKELGAIYKCCKTDAISGIAMRR